MNTDEVDSAIAVADACSLIAVEGETVGVESSGGWLTTSTSSADEEGAGMSEEVGVAEMGTAATSVTLSEGADEEEDETALLALAVAEGVAELALETVLVASFSSSTLDASVEGTKTKVTFCAPSCGDEEEGVLRARP